MGRLLLGRSLLTLFLLHVLLYHDQVVILVRRHHHIVDFARDTEERQVVLRVQVTHQTPGGYGELGKSDGVLCRFRAFAHCGANDLRLVALLHLCLLHDDEALDALVLLDARNTILDFRLYRMQPQKLDCDLESSGKTYRHVLMIYFKLFLISITKV